jgi:hypothetical protein
MMPAHVKIELTVREALAMQQALGNSLDTADDAEAIFDGDKVEVRAAYRGAEKLRQAINAKVSRS